MMNDDLVFMIGYVIGLLTGILWSLICIMT